MSFTIPDVAAAWNVIQSRLQSGDLEILAAGSAGVGVVSGCAVSPQGTPNMTVAVASGTVQIGGSSVAVSSGNVTITANSSGNPRLDLICVNGSGTKSAQAGTAAAAPKYPAIPGSSTVLAAVLVPTGASSITSNNIVDKRMTVPPTTGLLASNNLSDLVSVSSARTNLGLGTMATQSAAAVVITGGTITGLGTPSASSDAATKTYVDTVAGSGSMWKLPVRAATTANITLSGAQTIDAVAVVSGDRVLVKDQTTASQNGIYTVASGAWSRSGDADSSGEVVSGTVVYVSEGSVAADRVYALTTNGTITLGTTGLTFAPVTYAVGTTSGTVAAGDDARFSFPSSVTSTTYLKQPARAATTANITLSGAQTIDGVSVVAGNRVLVKDQSTASQNGLYVAASGAWTRATDADASNEVLAGMAVYVAEGTANGDKLFTLTTNDPITVGSTSLAFAAVSGSGGGASALDDLSDVAITSATQGQVVKRNATQWVNTSDTAIDARLYSSPQAAINASADGDTIAFRGDFTLSATLSLKAKRTYDCRGATFTMANGANLDAVAASDVWLSADNPAFADYPMQIIGGIFDGNASNQTSGLGHGLALQAFWTRISHTQFVNTRGSGVYIPSATRGAVTLTNGVGGVHIHDCDFYDVGGCGILVEDSTFSKNTDGWINNCTVGGCGSDAIRIDSAGGWFVVGCHLYGDALPIGRHGIFIVKPFFTTVANNYIEPYGSNVTYPAAGIAVGDGDASYANGSCTISGNVIWCGDVAGGVDTDAHPSGILSACSSSGLTDLTIVGNVLQGATHANVSTGINLSNQSSSATMRASLAGNRAFGWDKPYVSDANGGTLLIDGHTPGFGSVQRPAFASTITPNPYLGETVAPGALTGNLTVAAPAVTDPGKRMTFVFTQDTTGTRTVTFNAVFKKAGAAFTASTGNGAVSSISFVTLDGTNWLETNRSLAIA